MPTIKFIEHSGTEHEIDIPNGLTIMEGATKNKIPGIDADCGGACACATCHVYVSNAWLEKLPQKAKIQRRRYVRFCLEVKKNSRLSCQITVSDELEGFGD